MRIRYFAAAAQAAGTHEEHLDLDELLAGTPDHDGEATLGHVLELLSAREPIAAPASGDLLVRRATSLGTVLLRCSFLVNGVSAQDHSRALKPTDELDILPPFAGG
ncbi:MoaD/ThiS family protein [Paeniglutamicibacter sp. NPDC012692]|uniref:MoaD/ThiS family protein n=1 Tax=Paeniglutamicibacter sp. NPDC012692 TaxID=3364388 RepID=UPI0036982CF0